jgi:hypothetical protein
MGACVSAITDLYDAMAAQIAEAMEAAPYDVQVHPRMLINPTPPSIDIYPADPSRDPESGGFAGTDADAAEGMFVNVRARITPNDRTASQDLLLQLMDPESGFALVQSLYDDPTISGHAADVELDGESGFVVVPNFDGSAALLGVIWRFLVIPARS